MNTYSQSLKLDAYRSSPQTRPALLSAIILHQDLFDHLGDARIRLVRGSPVLDDATNFFWSTAADLAALVNHRRIHIGQRYLHVREACKWRTHRLGLDLVCTSVGARWTVAIIVLIRESVI